MKRVVRSLCGIVAVSFVCVSVHAQTCTISTNTIIQEGEVRECSSLKINPGITLTVNGTLSLPQGFSMNSGTLKINPSGVVHIQGEFLLSTGNNSDNPHKVEVINDGLLELWGNAQKGRFEMRPFLTGDFRPYDAAGSLYFTNNGTFNIKDCEFIVGKGQSDCSIGGAFFYNEAGARIYIDNKNYPSRQVWIGGKKGAADDVAIGNEKIGSGTAKKHATEQQAANAPYSQSQFYLFLNEGSQFIVKNTDANMKFCQPGNMIHGIEGEFFVYDANMNVSFGSGSGGQTPTIAKNGGVYVFDTTPSDHDQKGIMKIDAGGGDMQWNVYGKMYSTGLEAKNPLSSGSNQINVKAGSTVFIGNVGANAPSENYKVHVENDGDLFYCGNYSGGGDMIGWVDQGGRLYYAQNYYDWNWHHTSEVKPNEFKKLYDGPLMGNWRINADSTQLTNVVTGKILPLQSAANGAEAYFTIDPKPDNNGVNVNIYTPQGAGHQAIAEYCIVDSPWYISGTTLTNGTTMYSNVQSGTNPYYVKNTTTGKADIYTWKTEGYSQTNVDIVVSDYTMTNNVLKNNVTGETWNAYVNNQTPHYKIKPDGKVEIYKINTTTVAQLLQKNKGGKFSEERNWGVSPYVLVHTGGEAVPFANYAQMHQCPAINSSQNPEKLCYVDNGTYYTFKQQVNGQLIELTSGSTTTYTPVLDRTVSLATDWQIVGNVLTKTSTGETYQTNANKPTSTSNYYTARTGGATIYTYLPAGYVKTEEQPIRSDWQIVANQLKNTVTGETYNTINAGTRNDYYSVVNSGPGAACNKTATVWKYSDISFSKESLLVVTSGWYFDGTTLKNLYDLKIPYFDKTTGIPQTGQTEQIRDYSNNEGKQVLKTVLKYEKYIENGVEKVRVLSEIDDFYLHTGSTMSNMAQWGVFTADQCESKFLTDNVPPLFTGFLPVQLTSFAAVVQAGGGARVQWATQSETNNDYFTLYRSYDGVVFYAIATLAGAGTTTTPQTYSFGDNAIIPNIAYYKLGQTDYNGKETMTNIIAVRATNLPTFEIEKLQHTGNGNYSITLLFPDSEGENTVVMYNVNGVQVAHYTVAQGSVVSEVQLHAASGAYIIEHTCGARKSVKKITLSK
ncbi:MAG: hypothetical protein LBU90_07495 [Bacteroidales bacterium]|jgi:hypothetical protein|nr:hypothetical protein [Bacteroidales bacterium]